MNITEALKELGLPEGASKADVNSAFRKLAAQYHPDKTSNKPDLTEKFKRVNTAKQILDEKGTTPTKFSPEFGGFKVSVDNYVNSVINEDFFKSFFQQQQQQKYTQQQQKYTQKQRSSSNFNIHKTVKIPFEKAVLGGVVKLKYQRKDYSKQADGYSYYVNNEVTENLSLNLKPGAKSVTLKGQGHRNLYYAGNLHLKIEVIPDNEMHIEDNNVLSTVSLTLLEALKGCQKTVRTVKGERKLTIPPRITGGDLVRVANYGIPPNGAHLFKVIVEYPEDISDIVKLLEEKENNGV